MKKYLFFFLLSFLNFKAAKIYVNASAVGANNGLSWSNAYNDLQTAISNSIYGDEIWVASGNYKATFTTDRSISFNMKNGVNFYGGFNGTETSINQRDINQNPTTLSGDIGAIGDNSDNTNTVLKIISITSGITIDGFRIVSGRTGSGSAGIALNNNTGIINIQNCFFYDNFGSTAGAMFLAYQGNYTVNVSNCDFISNISVNGAIFTDDSNHNLNINNCRFKGSVAGGKAVMVFMGGNLVIDRCVVTNNTSTQSDLFYIDANISAKISNTLIAGNSYNEAGIAFYSSNSVSQILENVTIVHNRKTFLTNTADTAVFSVNGIAKVYNSIIYGNTNSSNNNQIDAGNTVSHSIVENGYSTGTNVLNTAPLFVNPGNLSLAPFDCAAYDYRVVNNSPAINSGNNVFVTQIQDLTGNTRIFDSTVDIGAYETTANLGLLETKTNEKTLFYDFKNETLYFKNNKNASIIIYDLSGKIILKENFKNQISLNHLKTGVYLINIENTSEKIKILKK